MKCSLTWFTRLLLVVIFSTGFLHSSHAGDADEVARLCALNTAAIDSVRALHCKIKITNSLFDAPIAEFWKDGSRIRMNYTEKGNDIQAVIQDGLVRYVVRQDVSTSKSMLNHPDIKRTLDAGRYHWHASTERDTGASPFSINPLVFALFRASDGGKNGNVTIAEFAKNHSRDLTSATSPQPGGAVVSQIEYTISGSVVKIQFDPSANYLCNKMEYVGSGDMHRSTHEVVKFREVQPGVYFPQEVQIRRWDKGIPQETEVIAFTNIQVNESISPSMFVLKYRNGIRMTNRVDGTQYDIDENGVQISDPKRMKRVSPPQSPVDTNTIPLRESQSEPRRSGWWVVPACVLILVGALGIWLFRRRASRRESS